MDQRAVENILIQIFMESIEFYSPLFGTLRRMPNRCLEEANRLARFKEAADIKKMI